MTRAVLAAAIVLALPAAAGAQLARDHAERAQDRRELGQDRRELARDRHDLRWMQELLARFDGARARRDLRALRAIEQDVSRTLAHEEREARLEVMNARGEVQRARGEAAVEQREERWERDGRRDVRDDRRDLRDDRRDLRDDRRDARRVAAIRSDFSRLQGRMDRRSLERKRAMLVELNVMAKAELREDRRELGEDRRELREDRRETREDLRR